MSTRSRFALIVGLVVALALSACSGDGDADESAPAIDVTSGEMSFAVELSDGSRWDAQQVRCTVIDSVLVVTGSIIDPILTMTLNLGDQPYLNVDGSVDEPIWAGAPGDEFAVTQSSDGTVSGVVTFGPESDRAGQTASVAGWCP